MHAGFLVALAASAVAWVGLDASAFAASVRGLDRDIQEVRIISAADSIEISNTHPHPMTVAVLAHTGEVVLGMVSGGLRVKFPVVIPPGARELRLTAYETLNRQMSVDGRIQLTPGKALASR